MKRNMDLVREILAKLEGSDADGHNIHLLAIEGYNEQEIEYHVRLLADTGLVTTPVQAEDESEFLGGMPTGLTWKGHDFIEAARKDSIWNKAKKIVIEQTGGMAFDLLKHTLLELGKRAIQGDPGTSVV